MTDRFEACLAHTLRWEGHWSDHPKDKGGPTMRGVTIRVYAGFLGIQLTERPKGTLVRDAAFGLVMERLRVLPDAHLHAIYRRQYWDMVRGDELPPGVDLAVFDFAVNSGPVRAAKYLQGILGTAKDGHIGAATLAALRAGNGPVEVVQSLMEARRAYLRGLGDYRHFGKGWENRCDGIEPVAVAMAVPAYPAFKTAVVLAAPLRDADAQSTTQGRATAPDAKPPWITEIVTSVTGTVTKVGGLSAAFGKWAAKPAAPPTEVALFFLAEPLVIAGIVLVFAALTTFLWRRRVGAAA